MRRDQLCEPGLCPDAPDDGTHCDHCPLDKLDAAQHTAKGLLIRRAIEIRGALRLGVDVTLDDLGADEFQAMLLLEEERDRLERESNCRGWKSAGKP